MTQLKLYFEFIQYSLGIKKESPAATAKVNWADFYRFAQKQSLLGIVFDGIQRLPKELAPDSDLLMRWMGNSLTIKRRNHVMYEASEDVYTTICKAGHRCCILKGQGNAIAYPNKFSRTAGDVDVWVLANRKELRQLAQELADSPTGNSREIVHHIELERKGVSVELHPTPMIFNNPILNYRMQKWFGRNEDLQCSNIMNLPDGIGHIAIPTSSFNAIYQLSHLYHHFFYEGVGLRQVIDYYLVVKNLEYNKSNSVLQRDLKRLGLWKFAGATMYVLQEVLDFPEEKMICPIDKKRGELLLHEILSGGNFGQYEKRHHFGRGTIGHNIQRLQRDLRLVRYYPAEALAEPFFRVWHFFWRLKNNV